MVVYWSLVEDVEVDSYFVELLLALKRLVAHEAEPDSLHVRLGVILDFDEVSFLCLLWINVELAEVGEGSGNLLVSGVIIEHKLEFGGGVLGFKRVYNFRGL